MADPASRSWQLIVTGDIPEPLPPELVADLTRLLDLRPDLAAIELDTGRGGIRAGRDWPSDYIQEANDLLARIKASPGVRGVALNRRPAQP